MEPGTVRKKQNVKQLSVTGIWSFKYCQNTILQKSGSYQRERLMNVNTFDGTLMVTAAMYVSIYTYRENHSSEHNIY